MKKMLIVAVLIILSAAAVALALLRQPKADLHAGTLSSRARQYITDRENQNDNSWHGLNFAGTRYVKADGPTPGSYGIGDCFSIRIPFAVTDVKKLGDCFNQYTITKPKGLVVVYKDRGTYDSLDDITGITMRRQQPAMYKEESRESGGNHFIVFTKTDESTYEKSAFLLKGKSLYMVNLLSSQYPDSDAQFDHMLTSLSISH